MPTMRGKKRATRIIPRVPKTYVMAYPTPMFSSALAWETPSGKVARPLLTAS
jgi:hypothetical protein